MRSRVAVLALVLLAGNVAGAARTADPVIEALGPSATRLPNGLWQITLDDGTKLTTHGPDNADNHGNTMEPGDPERPLVCASDYYQHVLYGRPASAPDLLASHRPTIEAAMRRMNHVLNEESLTSGNREADYKVKCDPQGNIRIDSFISGSNSFQGIASAAGNAGFDESNEDYTIFYDAPGGNVCGTGSSADDSSLSENNFNNTGGDYAVAYNGCWTNETVMHENGHNQGAVQYGAPYSTGSGAHCWDEDDVMCYSPDGGDKHQNGTVDVCTDRIHFDCNNDSYFDSAPEFGEWLYDHWNIGSTLNRFIHFGGPIVDPPRAGMLISCSDLTCNFTDASTDVAPGQIVSWRWDFGQYWNYSTQQHPTWTYFQAGVYGVRLTVRDDSGGSDQWIQRLYVPNNGDVDTTTPNLTNNVAYNSVSGAINSWRWAKIFVPAGKPSVTFTLEHVCAITGACSTTDLDMYVRPGTRPTTTTFVCRSNRILSSDESCVVDSPMTGYWYVGVYVAQALPIVPGTNLYSVQFRLKAAY